MSKDNNIVTPDRPQILSPKFDSIPSVLRSIDRWVLWKLELVNNRWSKVPKQAGGRNADVSDASTWTTFDKACAAYTAAPDRFSGIGIVLSDPVNINGRSLYLVGLDFDHCVNGTKADSFIREIRSKLDTYTEFSPSGTGIRMFVLSSTPVQTRKVNVNGNSREIYSDKRYLTVTGRGKGEVRHVV